jgi:hypothetical protein
MLGSSGCQASLRLWEDAMAGTPQSVRCATLPAMRLSPLEALQTATNPARVLEMADSLGSIDGVSRWDCQ